MQDNVAAKQIAVHSCFGLIKARARMHNVQQPWVRHARSRLAAVDRIARHGTSTTVLTVLFTEIVAPVENNSVKRSGLR